MTEGNSAPLARWNVGSAVNSIAVSPNGNRIVSGSDDPYIRVWDVRTGALILGPLQGHQYGVKFMAFSPDDTRIVSGSSDQTIRIWDAHTGTHIGEPLQVLDRVTSVVFSPDSTRLVAGSNSGLINIWNAQTGACMSNLKSRHAGRVHSVSFSPNGDYIASDSQDDIIYIWDAHTGNLTGEPLKGHTDIVLSVAFSPDSTRIASGSGDSTVRIWDVHSRRLVGEPLNGHTRYVRSVMFSRDGTCIVSASEDYTIRIWNAQDGTPIGKALEGHDYFVTSVVFADNNRVISASWDRTICVWEVPRNTPIFNMVSSKMSSQDMFDCLVQRGCTDLSLSLDKGRNSHKVIASGGFGDVWYATMFDGKPIAIKTLRLHILLQEDDKGLKRAVREVYIWSKLQHPNVQELFGMVSPWREQGNLQRYISMHPEVERYPLCIQLGEGLSYLHGINMAHGDLKANNVLVAQDGTLKINDFDHAILAGSTLRFSTTTRPGGGTFRWMAPELYDTDEQGAEEDTEDKTEDEVEEKREATRNKQTDVYAFAMTMLEIITGAVPYAECRTDAGVCAAILKKRFPKRPKELLGTGARETQMWELLKQCWDHDPEARPDASSALEFLKTTVLGAA